jgi:hypothetical protein
MVSALDNFNVAVAPWFGAARVLADVESADGDAEDLRVLVAEGLILAKCRSKLGSILCRDIDERRKVKGS